MFLPITLFRISFPFVTKLSNGKNHCPSFLLLLLRRLLQTREEERRERLQLSTSCSPPPFNALSPLFYLNTCVSVSTQGGFLAPLFFSLLILSFACLPTVSLSCSKKKRAPGWYGIHQMMLEKSLKNCYSMLLSFKFNSIKEKHSFCIALLGHVSKERRSQTLAQLLRQRWGGGGG